jgi:phenylacetate-CoA ligase
VTVDLDLPRVRGEREALAVAARAARNVAFYAERFDAIALDRASLMDLPVLTKDEARREQRRMVRPAAPSQRRVVDHTSGSTGIPLRCVRTESEVLRAATALWRARMAHLPDITSVTGVQVSASELVQADAPSDRTVRLSAFELHPDRIEHHLEAIDAHRPRWLRGHPAVLAVLAAGIRRTCRPLRSPLALVESNSGWLSAETRALLADAFQCPVVNHYGTRETYTISYECPSGRMHLFDDCVVVQVGDGAEREGEVVATSLIFECMPFIRYAVGDLARLEPAGCACGSPAPVLTPLGGRSGDLIDGTALVGTYVFHAVVTRLARAGLEDVLQYQVAQTDRRSFHVRLVLADGAAVQRVAHGFADEARRIIPDAHLSFEAVEAIDPGPGGKPQSFVKEL